VGSSHPLLGWSLYISSPGGNRRAVKLSGILKKIRHENFLEYGTLLGKVKEKIAKTFFTMYVIIKILLAYQVGAETCLGFRTVPCVRIYS
jgi:hypothetical protein